MYFSCNVYLSDRQQRVRLSGLQSFMKTIMKGVPQGSILGPILFNIFMNDLSYEWTLFMYADDTQLFKSAEDSDQVEHVINFAVFERPYLVEYYAQRAKILTMY